MTLLRGPQDAHAEEITCDGVRMDASDLAGFTTLMPQYPAIFADTVRFNITFGMDASDEEILEAVRVARFDAVLERLPAGLETNIAEQGVNLSGGEKQRLALARGIFFTRTSEIMLLDEPTSSVDTANERAIYESLMAAYRDRCVVSSVHKLHLLPMFDQTYVFENGRLVDERTFQTLLARRGALARMWAAYQTAGKDAAPAGDRRLLRKAA